MRSCDRLDFVEGERFMRTQGALFDTNRCYDTSAVAGFAFRSPRDHCSFHDISPERILSSSPDSVVTLVGVNT
jgi:hypothetical protein